jgi:hypothetical protein
MGQQEQGRSPVKTPAHLKGLIGALTAVEKACEGTDYEWLITKRRDGYLANIYSDAFNETYPHHAKTPAEALSNSLMKLNLRTNRKKP